MVSFSARISVSEYEAAAEIPCTIPVCAACLSAATHCSMRDLEPFVDGLPLW